MADNISDKVCLQKLVSRGIEGVLLKPTRPKQGRAVFPLIRSKGAKVNLTNKRLYEHVEFP